jgi:hypothetical protein
MLVDSREIEGQILTTPIIDFSPQFHHVGEYQAFLPALASLQKCLLFFISLFANCMQICIWLVDKKVY